MSLQLIIRDIKGKIVASHALNAGSPLSLQVPAQAGSLEVHSNDGVPPKKITVSKSDDALKLHLADELSGEQYDIVLENHILQDVPAVYASGPDGALYAYNYDLNSGIYELSSSQVETITTDNLLAIGGAFAAAAALVGIASAAGSHNHHSAKRSSSSSSQQAASDSQSDAAAATVITDQLGNVIANGRLSPTPVLFSAAVGWRPAQP